MIGGRGTGKSTVLRFLRLVLNRKNELPESLMQEFDDFARISHSRLEAGLLHEDTRVTLVMNVEGVEKKLIWEKNRILEEVDGALIDAESVISRFPVNIFSQKQLFEMTKNPYLLFEYIDAEWNYSQWEHSITTVRSDYMQWKNRIRELQNKLKSKMKLKTLLGDIEKKIAVFETEEIKSIIVESKKLEKAEKLLEKTYDRYKTLLQSVDYIRKFKSVDDYDISVLDKESADVINKWCANLNDMVSQINVIIEAYTNDCIPYEQLLSRTKMLSLQKKNATEMRAVLEKLKANGVDGIDKYADLIVESTAIQNDLRQYEDLDNEISSAAQHALSLKEEFMTLIERRFDNRNKIIQQWNELGDLRLTLKCFGDIRSSEQKFRKILRKDTEFESDIARTDVDTGEIVGGFIHTVCTDSQGQSAKERMENLEREKNRLLRPDGGYTKRFYSYLNKSMSTFENMEDEIELWVPDDSIELEILVNGRYKPVSIGSPGERTSAILSLIFSISRNPVIIDQPEDDLDTRNITDLVVKGISKLRPLQQIILVTHNPNIVVNTNSDQVVHLDYHRGQIVNTCQGALQDHDVRNAICEVMEGGREALRQRYYRIFQALSQ